MIKGKQIDNPLTLTETLAYTNYIGPGDTVYLRGGTYSGDFTCSLVGAVDSPVIIRPYPGEQALIDGTWQMVGQYCYVVGVEFTFTAWENRDNSTYVIGTTQALDIKGVGNRLIGCRIHDVFNVGSWVTNQHGGLYDCLVYNVGANVGGNDPQGHCLYTQNLSEWQYHHNNILWGAYNYGFHAYTSGSTLYYFDVLRNICFRNGGRQFAAGGLGGQRCSHFTSRENCTYPGASEWYKGNYGDFDGDYWPRGMHYDTTGQNNSFGDDLVYGDTDPYAEPTTGTVIRVYPREYQDYFPGWAHIAIYNWEQANSVTVDLAAAAGLNVGDSYTLHNAMDYDNDTVTGTVPANKTIAVDMQAVSHSVAARVGSETLADTTFPKFGCFVLEKIP